jgi:hypothetical protein
MKVLCYLFLSLIVILAAAASGGSKKATAAAVTTEDDDNVDELTMSPEDAMAQLATLGIEVFGWLHSYYNIKCLC